MPGETVVRIADPVPEESGTPGAGRDRGRHPQREHAVPASIRRSANSTPSASGSGSSPTRSSASPGRQGPAHRLSRDRAGAGGRDPREPDPGPCRPRLDGAERRRLSSSGSSDSSPKSAAPSPTGRRCSPGQELIADTGKTRRRFRRRIVGEAIAFLEWLADDNFTFLGIRDYRLLRRREARRAASAPTRRASASSPIPSVRVLRRGARGRHDDAGDPRIPACGRSR